jgi:hypothetical protein
VLPAAYFLDAADRSIDAGRALCLFLGSEAARRGCAGRGQSSEAFSLPLVVAFLLSFFGRRASRRRSELTTLERRE